MIYAVIMAGGKGERFWPLSRLKTPKQLLSIVEERTMIQATVERIAPIVPKENILIITNQVQKDVIAEQLPDLNPDHIIAEPCGRNTAPCLALAAAYVADKDPESIMIVLPADHVIHDTEAFCANLSDIAALAKGEDALFTIGIQPQHPATGYGYIHAGASLRTQYDTNFAVVNRFTEKPDAKTAQAFVESGEYFWNSGIFVWRTGVFVDALNKYMPDLYESYLHIKNAVANKTIISELERIYPTLEGISIDYGVMEKAERVLVAQSCFDWDDVGAWDAVAKHLQHDADSNVAQGKYIAVDSKDCIIFSNNKFVGTVGVDNLIVVATDDAILVCDKSRAQDVKKLVQCIGKDETLKDLL